LTAGWAAVQSDYAFERTKIGKIGQNSRPDPTGDCGWLANHGVLTAIF
jgi:hypothetical protein